MSKPKDLWELPIKRSLVRREVFKIHPIYRQDYEAAFQDFVNGLMTDLAVRSQADLREAFIYSPQAKELCQRWGLSLALHPDDGLWDTPPGTAPALFEDPGFAVTVIPHGKAKINPPPPENTSDRIHRTPLLKKGRYLCLEIDLFKTKSQIEVEIKDTIERFQASIVSVPKSGSEQKPNSPHSASESSKDLEHCEPKQVQENKTINIGKKTGRGPSLDIYLDEEPASGPVTIFQVWNLNKKENKSPWEIAQELYPTLNGKSYQDKAKNYDSDAKRLHQQIVDAINRVNKLISSLTPSNS